MVDDEESSEPRSTPTRGEYPIDGSALVKTAALASVPAEQLPGLLARVQADLGPRIDDYRRRYERIAVEPDRETFLVEPDHWESVGERLSLSERERDAVVRAHEAAVERAGSGQTSRDEFETALEIRSGVVIGTGTDHTGREDESGRPGDEE
ncbi:hypothetical protein [Halorubrum sp. HHNYT27]|uniref:hypothetical protein n=1 Tax=Halorubrum sp. HHNYT27 TaxID=3402275 RepID=UPI003EB9CF04